MLIKKEILTVPKADYEMDEKASKGTETFVLVARVNDLSRSGKVLIVDIFGTHGTKRRFTTDGDNFVFYDFEKNEWNRRTFLGNTNGAGRYWYGRDCFKIDKQSRITILNYLFPNKNHSEYANRDIGAICNEITTNKAYERRQVAADNKAKRINRHVKMAPNVTNDMLEYCKNTIFPKYIFYSKLSDKKIRTGKCSHCNKSFRLPKAVKHKSETVCPKCGCKAYLWAKQYISSIENKTLLTVCGDSEKQLIISNHEVVLSYTHEANPVFEKNLCYVRLYLTGERKKIYSYRYKHNQYYGWNWYEEKWAPTDKTTVYPYNLREVFGNKYYGVDLQSTFEKYIDKVNYIKLLDNLQDYPQAEYLVKSGLVKLTSEMSDVDFGNGRTFEDLLGISKSLIPLYVENSVTIDEHRLIVAAGNVTEDELLRIRSLKPKGDTYNCMSDIFSQVSIKKFLNYIAKQKALYADSDYEQIIRWYRDYLNICDELNIRLTKSGKCPKDLKNIHDKLAAQLNEIQDILEIERFEYAKKKLYSENMNYCSNGYVIVMPSCREDLIREGQILHHCVGSEHYYKDHKSGKKMIFFIRKEESPNIPFVTLQVDMMRQSLIQCYGANDKAPPTAVRQFAKKFIKQLKKPLNMEDVYYEKEQNLQQKVGCA